MAQPNMRLKLVAPVLKASSGRGEMRVLAFCL